VKFEWDEAKAAANLAKHGISFDEASEVFKAPHRISISDTRHDYGEERTNTTGMVNGILVLTVTHTDRQGVVCLISARPASRRERNRYYE
jgi:uncharacterized DUF497 family protein